MTWCLMYDQQISSFTTEVSFWVVFTHKNVVWMQSGSGGKIGQPTWVIFTLEWHKNK